jgi:hypothetical protein
MARKPTPAPATPESTFDETVTLKPLNEIAVIDQAAQEHVVALAQQLGYQGALSVGALEDGIRFYQQRTAEACMELGKRLVLLKETTQHGEFKPRLESLGIEYGAAKRFMGVASKFSKGPTSALLKAANSQSKLIELLVLDDTEVLELEEGGTVRGLTVDDVDRMGVRELRANLRESRADKVADDKRLAELHKANDKLHRLIEKSTPDDVLLKLQKEATALMNDALGCIRGNLRHACIALKNHSEEDHSLFTAGLVGQVQAAITSLREEFELPDVSIAADAEVAADFAKWSKD